MLALTRAKAFSLLLGIPEEDCNGVFTYSENALAFPAGTGGNNSRADEHRNEDCAENEVVRHNGGPFGGAVLGCLLWARRERLEQSKDVLSWYTEPFHLLGSDATKVLFRDGASRAGPLF